MCVIVLTLLVQGLSLSSIVRALHFVPEQTIHFFQGGFSQGRRLDFGPLCGRLEHGWQNPPGNVSILD